MRIGTRTRAAKTLGELKGEKVFEATQWQLVWWKFSRHKLAVASLVILGFLYIGVLFAEFVSPYDPTAMDKNYIDCPPTVVRFRDTEGRVRIRPFVYAKKGMLDPRSLMVTYTDDTSTKYFLRFFVRGASTSCGGSGVEAPPLRDGRAGRAGSCSLARTGRAGTWSRASLWKQDLALRAVRGHRLHLRPGDTHRRALRVLRGHHGRDRAAHHRVPALHPLHPALDGAAAPRCRPSGASPRSTSGSSSSCPSWAGRAWPGWCGASSWR